MDEKSRKIGWNFDGEYARIMKKENRMGKMGDQLKMVNEARKIAKELKNEIIEVEAGDGALVLQVSGEMKVIKVEVDPEKIDLNDPAELERWIQNAVNDGFAKAQEIATEKMKPMMGQLGGLGL